MPLVDAAVPTGGSISTPPLTLHACMTCTIGYTLVAVALYADGFEED